MTNKEHLTAVIAGNIAYYRKKANLTQLELAERLSYSDKSVSKWERGEGLPDVLVLQDIADALGVALGDLLSEKKITGTKTFFGYLKSYLYALIPWVVATIVFSSFTIALYGWSSYLLFIYAVPVSAAILLVFNLVWKRPVYIYALFTILVWSLAVSLHLTLLDIGIAKAYMAYIIAIPVYLLFLLLLYLIYKL